MTTPAQYLFTRALDLPEADPARACGEDAELRLEVQRTLVGSAYSDSFFGDENGATLGAEEFKEAFSPPPAISSDLTSRARQKIALRQHARFGPSLGLHGQCRTSKSRVARLLTKERSGSRTHSFASPDLRSGVRRHSPP